MKELEIIGRADESVDFRGSRDTRDPSREEWITLDEALRLSPRFRPYEVKRGVAEGKIRRRHTSGRPEVLRTDVSAYFNGWGGTREGVE